MSGAQSGASGGAPSRPRLLLGGLVMLVLLSLGMIALFALHQAQLAQQAAVAREIRLTTALDTGREAEIAFKVQVQEWKNLLLRGYDPALAQPHRAGFAQQREAVAERLAALRDQAPRLGDGPAAALLVGRLPGLIAAHATLNAQYDATLAGAELTSLAGIQAADTAVRGADRALQRGLDQLGAGLLQAMVAERAASDAADQARHATLRLVLQAAVAAGLLITLALLYLVARSQPRRV